MKKNRQRGFTYIEMMIVLMMVSVILLISLPQSRANNDQMEFNYFLKEMEQDLYYYQLLAVAKGRSIRFIFHSLSPKYTVLEGMTVLAEREGPDSVRFEEGSLKLNDVRFLPRGGVYKSGSINIKFEGANYLLIFHLNRGRFYLEEL